MDNVVIFVADALRLDYLPDRIKRKGDFVETIASSTVSPASFSSILSGLHPTEHNVFTFYHQLDQSTSLLGIDDFNTSFWQVLLDGGMYDVLGQDVKGKQRLSELEPPFIYVERENSTHSPYGEWTEEWFEPSDDAHTIWGGRPRDDMWGRFRGDWEKIQEKYHTGANTAAERFQERLGSLRDRGLLDDTLVIFTSDHGELLGEYSEKSHSRPVVSELVRVPTVIFNPDGRTVPESCSLMSHVDIVPTIGEALDTEFDWELSGQSVYSSGQSWGYNHYHRPKGGVLRKQSGDDLKAITIESIWDRQGGYVYKHSSGESFGTRRQATEVFRTIGKHVPLVGSPWARVRHLPAALRYHLTNPFVDGSPIRSNEEARRLLQTIPRRDSVAEDTIDISPAKQRHLEDLGYS
ncbi:Arylsulfatase A [Halorhabdus sp. SVX81]|uniref:sulfatase-like hydrolase/transferase n=1 Tax=Halorhabdus sp. SVX81 TaxID=2978283 RepID=UPI0023D98CF2|nr:sulfatase-like hydrolase/transferase [Halorhabdus sp. SVX81]WEL16670.1 Arylsulfatase A [Halorhabdus sp. SVX81]